MKRAIWGYKRLICTSPEGEVRSARTLRAAAVIIGVSASSLSQAMKKRSYSGVAMCKGWTIRAARPLVVVFNERAHKMWLCAVDSDGRYMRCDGTGELEVLPDMRVKEVTEVLWEK